MKITQATYDLAPTAFNNLLLFLVTPLGAESSFPFIMFCFSILQCSNKCPSSDPPLMLQQRRSLEVSKLKSWQQHFELEPIVCAPAPCKLGLLSGETKRYLDIIHISSSEDC